MRKGLTNTKRRENTEGNEWEERGEHRNKGRGGMKYRSNEGEVEERKEGWDGGRKREGRKRGENKRERGRRGGGKGRWQGGKVRGGAKESNPLSLTFTSCCDRKESSPRRKCNVSSTARIPKSTRRNVAPPAPVSAEPRHHSKQTKHTNKHQIKVTFLFVTCLFFLLWLPGKQLIGVRPQKPLKVWWCNAAFECSWEETTTRPKSKHRGSDKEIHRIVSGSVCLERTRTDYFQVYSLFIAVVTTSPKGERSRDTSQLVNSYIAKNPEFTTCKYNFVWLHFPSCEIDITQIGTQHDTM